MFFSFATPLAILSIFPHQEPRFLIPLLIPLVFSFSSFLQSNESDSTRIHKLKRLGFVIWFICNIILTLFLGVFHQGGIFHLVRHFNAELKSKPRATTLHLITSHIYDIPQSLLLTANSNRLRTSRAGHKYYLSKQIHIHEMRSSSTDEIVNKAKVVWEVNQKLLKSKRQGSRIYIAIPAPLSESLFQSWFNANISHLGLIKEDSYFPHWSSEASPYFPSVNNSHCLHSEYDELEVNWSWDVNLSLLQRFTCYVKQFSLELYRIDRMFFRE